MNARIRPDWDIRDAILDMGGDDAFSQYLWGFMDGRPLVNRFTHLDQVPFPAAADQLEAEEHPE